MTFQIFQFVIILIVLIIVARYAWGVIFDKHYQPVEWERMKKSGQVDPELIRLEKHYPDKVRFFNWWFQVERLRRDGVQGDFAELGVYKGESAKVLHLMDPSRTFHLYDTFEGFKEEDLEGETGEAATYTTRNFADTSVKAVRRYLGDSDRFVFHTGRFQPHPQTLPLRGGEQGEGFFALVNMDADLYAPTKAGLEYFYPLLNPGGVLLVHDYNYKWPGIIKAVDEFAANIPEALIMVPDMEGTVMFVKNA